MEIRLGVIVEADSKMTGEPNDVYDRVEKLEQALHESGLESWKVIIKPMPMTMTASHYEAEASAQQAADESPQTQPFSGRLLSDVLIEELELGVRAYNHYKRNGIQTVEDAVKRSVKEIEAIPNTGSKSREELEEALAKHGLVLRQEEEK